MRSQDEDINNYIDANPSSQGLAEALIAATDIPVWAIIGYLQATNWDIARTAGDYGISTDAVKAAIAFYEAHREVIDERIAANVIHAD